MTVQIVYRSTLCYLMVSHLFLPLTVVDHHKFTVISFADGSSKRITFRGAFNARGTLSADGKKVALVHRPSGSSYKVAIQDINTGDYQYSNPNQSGRIPKLLAKWANGGVCHSRSNRGLLSIMSVEWPFPYEFTK